jgi:hypothetical protein
MQYGMMKFRLYTEMCSQVNAMGREATRAVIGKGHVKTLLFVIMLLFSVTLGLCLCVGQETQRLQRSLSFIMQSNLSKKRVPAISFRFDHLHGKGQKGLFRPLMLSVTYFFTVGSC